MATNKTHKSRITAKELEVQCLELRKAGLSYEHIKVRLDLPSKSTAYSAVSRALKKLTEEVKESAEEVRELELERLDKMLNALEPEANKGNVQAIDRVIRIQERRARYLGLDAPTKTEVKFDLLTEEDIENATPAQREFMKKYGTRPPENIK